VTTVTAAEALVTQLESYGVEYVFGTCGHTNIALLDALGPSSIHFVIARHEQAAAHAADGYARASGKPGVLLTHVGPGMMNAVTGVATAIVRTKRPPAAAVTRFDCVRSTLPKTRSLPLTVIAVSTFPVIVAEPELCPRAGSAPSAMRVRHTMSGRRRMCFRSAAETSRIVDSGIAQLYTTVSTIGET
jgi:glyoxylate carboligase